MRIAEIYKSTQGEGLLTGTPSVFIRASGCNLRCWYCDTPFASWKPEGIDLGVDEIMAQVDEWDCRHVVITGGEPMLFAELIPLCEELRRQGRHVTIETAGTLFLPLECDLMSVSPKFASSAPDRQAHHRWHHRHNETRHRPDIVRELIDQHVYQLKFVVDTPDDLSEVQQYLVELGSVEADRVLLMPQGVEQPDLLRREEWLRPFCLLHGYVFCPRKQIEWYGALRGT
ncbi:7-carboxy-7-deazaguanine synthase QueE [Aeoliella sp. ICT_H6.2]|uniref:7-carboxy-7-deazaguanine synthase n=1 Tax=Aeoliella straminimaris TaxID=2954799 RepID=A0A9X2FI23_9BACT|nr:7-carboxy-7-deazaguanine synthase QueE [Aeoliella straminimaris]MCO6045496.1 7-carboxy-7-deazaguanine synthase QueE [Aeoliella straminimaris]